MQLKIEMLTRDVALEPQDWILTGLVDCIESDLDGAEDYIIGRVAVDYFAWGHALENGRESVRTICDADSRGWLELYDAIFVPCEPNVFPDYREDLGLEYADSTVAYIYRCVFHPEMRRSQQSVVDRIAGLFPGSVAVLLQDATELTPGELDELGFAKANSELLVRSNANVHPFHKSTRHQDQEVELNPNSSWEDWGEKTWRQEDRPAGESPN